MDNYKNTQNLKTLESVLTKKNHPHLNPFQIYLGYDKIQKSRSDPILLSEWQNLVSQMDIFFERVSSRIVKEIE